MRARPSPLLVWPVVLVVLGLVIFAEVLVPGNNRLYDAIEKSDEARVRALLEGGADPNSRSRGLKTKAGSRHQFPPLNYAIWKGEAAIATMLVEAGADPDSKNPRREPALISAADAGMTDVVRALIAKGVNVRVTSGFDDSTPLHRTPRVGIGVPKELEPEIRAMLEKAGAR